MLFRSRPVRTAENKLSTAEYRSIELIENPDIIATLAARKDKQFLIGFAAQTGGDARTKATTKLAEKQLDLIYLNDVSDGKIFGDDKTIGEIISKDGKLIEFQRESKMTLANTLLDIAIDKLG
mgnify:CR=1 FL=1